MGENEQVLSLRHGINPAYYPSCGENDYVEVCCAMNEMDSDPAYYPPGNLSTRHRNQPAHYPAGIVLTRHTYWPGILIDPALYPASRISSQQTMHPASFRHGILLTRHTYCTGTLFRRLNIVPANNRPGIISTRLLTQESTSQA